MLTPIDNCCVQPADHGNRPVAPQTMSTWPTRYANYYHLIRQPVTVKRGCVKGVIQAARTADDGSAELLVVIGTGEILALGVSDVLLTNAQAMLDDAHKVPKPVSISPSPKKKKNALIEPENPTDLQA